MRDKAITKPQTQAFEASAHSLCAHILKVPGSPPGWSAVASASYVGAVAGFPRGHSGLPACAAWTRTEVPLENLCVAKQLTDRLEGDGRSTKDTIT